MNYEMNVCNYIINHTDCLQICQVFNVNINHWIVWIHESFFFQFVLHFGFSISWKFGHVQKRGKHFRKFETWVQNFEPRSWTKEYEIGPQLCVQVPPALKYQVKILWNWVNVEISRQIERWQCDFHRTSNYSGIQIIHIWIKREEPVLAKHALLWHARCLCGRLSLQRTNMSVIGRSFTPVKFFSELEGCVWRPQPNPCIVSCGFFSLRTPTRHCPKTMRLLTSRDFLILADSDSDFVRGQGNSHTSKIKSSLSPQCFLNPHADCVGFAARFFFPDVEFLWYLHVSLVGKRPSHWHALYGGKKTNIPALAFAEGTLTKNVIGHMTAPPSSFMVNWSGRRPGPGADPGFWSGGPRIPKRKLVPQAPAPVCHPKSWHPFLDTFVWDWHDLGNRKSQTWGCPKYWAMVQNSCFLLFSQPMLQNSGDHTHTLWCEFTPIR